MIKLFNYRTTFGLVVLATVFAVIVGILTSVRAQTSADASQGIEISPALVELNAEKGKTYTVKIKVTNVTLTKLTYTTSINDFTSQGETGSPQVLLDSTLPATASVVTWVSIEPEFTLESRESRTLIATINVPADAEPGGHYGVVRFAGRAPDLDQNSGVGLSASAGMLMLIRVAGDITESATLEEFFSASDGNQTSLFETGPIEFVTRVKNDGNIHVKPVGNIEVRNAFGNSVASLPVNESKSNVLPNSIRRFENEFNRDWMFGMYSADLTLGYGTTGQAITNTITFWVIPYKLVLAIIVGFVTFVFIASRLIKVYNKRIIAKAQHENNKNKNHTKKKN
jgi:hypothetical protein